LYAHQEAASEPGPFSFVPAVQNGGISRLRDRIET
jgi:hypothetical protein